jgi:GDP-L-fucose synthase
MTFTNSVMRANASIYIAGHLGLVGSALLRRLDAAGYTNLLYRTHAELDLTDAAAVREFFTNERPEYVFLAAAKVGGIIANATYPADFISQNLQIQTNVIQEAHRSGATRLLFLGSSCIYPKHAPQPIREEYLLTGPLEETNRPYAIAKIAGIEMCWSFNRQFGTTFLAAMPTNLYGLSDHYDLVTSHVIPALIRKMYEAKVNGAREVPIWGTGNPRREFLFSDDAADACIFLMNLSKEHLGRTILSNDSCPIVNVGCGTDITIREIAEMIAEVVGFRGSLRFDTSKPDGTPRKLMDVTRLSSLGWIPKTTLREGLRKTYLDFVDHNVSVKELNPAATKGS